MKRRSLGESLFIYLILSVITVATVMALRLLFSTFAPPITDLTASATERRKIVIDPGHGGKDGGAVSHSGTSEKLLTLDISLTMREVMHILGYDTVMTREDDTELTHISGGTRKMQDLKGRLEVAEKNPDAIFVSIHINKFPIPKYRGLQVYYSPNHRDSEGLALALKDTVRTLLQPDNDRPIKRAGSNIFLLDRITSPSILVECGFVSNPEEAALLDSYEYRCRLSKVIALSIINYNER